MVDYTPTTALLVVDVQNDFADPAGALYVRGGEEVVPLVNEEIAQATRAGAFVVYTQDWHPEHTPHFQADGGFWPVHCVQASWGAALYPGLQADGPIVRKGSGDHDGYSGFSVRDARTGVAERTELEALLRAHQVDRVVIVGLATDYCVRETALDAIRLGFKVTVIEAAVRAVDLQLGDGARSLAEMRRAGVQLA